MNCRKSWLFLLCLVITPPLFASEPVAVFTPAQIPGWFLAHLPPRTAAQTLNIIDYVRSHVTHETLSDIENRIPHYNRLEDFGGWTKPDDGSTCYDTRANVLIRSADPAVKLGFTSTGCTVAKGLWHDPYAGTDYKLAKAVQIDHVVPLKHAYLTGASTWAPERRCYYANFLHNAFHLLAVSGHENMSKGDNSPAKYLPPSESFQCEYVATWLKIKTIWDLVATDDEMAAIDQVITSRHCSNAKFDYDQTELQNERNASQDVSQHCKDFGAVGFVPQASTSFVF